MKGRNVILWSGPFFFGLQQKAYGFADPYGNTVNEKKGGKTDDTQRTGKDHRRKDWRQ